MTSLLKKCFRKKIILSILLVILLFSLTVVWTNYFATKELELILERVRSSKAPLHPTQIIPEIPLSKDNAQNVYKKVFSCYPWDDEYSDMRTFLEDAFDQLFRSSEWALTNKEKAFLDQHEEISRFLIQASEKKECVYLVDWSQNFATELPHLAEIASPLRFALMQTFRLAIEGQYEKSSDLLKGCLMFSRSMEKDPVLISYLVEIARYRMVLQIAFLLYGHFPEMRSAIRELFETQRPKLKELFFEKMKAERVFLIATFFDMLRSRYSVKDIADVFASYDRNFFLQTLNYCPLWMLSPFIKLDLAYTLKGYEKLLSLADSPSWVAIPKIRNISREHWDKIPFYAIWTQLTRIDFSSTFERHLNLVAQEELFFFALDLYDAAPGDTPFRGDITELAKKVNFSNQDPFTGKPYLTRQEGNTLFIYSASENLQDDQGKLFDYLQDPVLSDWDTGWKLVWGEKIKFAPIATSQEELEDGEKAEKNTTVSEAVQIPEFLLEMFDEAKEKYAKGNYTDAILLLQSALKMTVISVPEIEQRLETWKTEHQERLETQVRIFLEQEELPMAKLTLTMFEKITPKKDERLQIIQKAYQEKVQLSEHLKQQKEHWKKTFQGTSMSLRSIHTTTEDQQEKTAILMEYSRNETNKSYYSESVTKAREVCRQTIIEIAPDLPKDEQERMLNVLFTAKLEGIRIELADLFK